MSLRYNGFDSAARAAMPSHYPQMTVSKEINASDQRIPPVGNLPPWCKAAEVGAGHGDGHGPKLAEIPAGGMLRYG